jgi:hypothetical protein
MISVANIYRLCSPEVSDGLKVEPCQGGLSRCEVEGPVECGWEIRLARGCLPRCCARASRWAGGSQSAFDDVKDLPHRRIPTDRD